MLVIYCDLERENYKVLKFHVNISCNFEIRVSFFFKCSPCGPQISAAP